MGGLLEFIRGPRKLLEKNYKAYGEVFTVPLLHKRMTFLIGPYAANHFFKATDEELSQASGGAERAGKPWQSACAW